MRTGGGHLLDRASHLSIVSENCQGDAVYMGIAHGFGKLFRTEILIVGKQQTTSPMYHSGYMIALRTPSHDHFKAAIELPKAQLTMEISSPSKRDGRRRERVRSTGSYRVRPC
jgi:hypothetical protein